MTYAEAGCEKLILDLLNEDADRGSKTSYDFDLMRQKSLARKLYLNWKKSQHIDLFLSVALYDALHDAFRF